MTRPGCRRDQASITIGQSVSTTALQLAAAYSIFANDGLYVPPYLVEGGLAEPTHQVVSPEVAMTMRTLLQYTAENSGIHRSAIPGVTMAGKTGTADIFDLDTGTYIKDDYTLTFAGMMPADRPQFRYGRDRPKTAGGRSQQHLGRRSPFFSHRQRGGRTVADARRGDELRHHPLTGRLWV